MAAVRRLLVASSRGIVFYAKSSKKLAESFKRACDTGGAAGISHLVGLLDEMSMKGGTYICESGHEFLAKNAQRLGRAVDAIHQRFREELSLAELSELASIHPASFSRAFRKAFGLRLQDYLISLRLNESCRLLVETDATIAETAFASGFRNLSNFNRHFQKKLKCPPHQYQAEMKDLCRAKLEKRRANALILTEQTGVGFSTDARSRVFRHA